MQFFTYSQMLMKEKHNHLFWFKDQSDIGIVMIQSQQGI